MTCGREDQRDRLRGELQLAGNIEVVRGGADDRDKLRAHARRTARAWCLDGVPILGVSVFCALDDIGPGSLRVILARRLNSYRKVHLTTVRALTEAGLSLLATGRRPHFTLVVPSDVDSAFDTLLAALGPALDNREYLRARWGPGGPEL